MKQDILIIGYGNIGKHMYEELKGAGNIDIYDAYQPEHMFSYQESYNVAFVCVPTDMKEDGSCDTSVVEEVIRTHSASVFVIKSTVPVGTCEQLSIKYHKKIVFSPEYYGTTQHAPSKLNFVVLAGSNESCSVVAQYYYKVKKRDFRIVFTDYRTAELAKYMENCFLALKVTFCSEFFTIARSMGISYEKLREIFVLDERMGDSHTFVNSQQPYYDSHCLNKDIPGLIKQTDKAHLMEAMLDINRKKRIDKEY